MVDAESIETRLDRLTQLLEELDEIRAGGRDTYDADFRTRLAAQHGIQLAIQVCIDIGLADRLADAASMRNVLVHGYLEVDDEAVWQALEHLDDLRQFAAFAREKAA